MAAKKKKKKRKLKSAVRKKWRKSTGPQGSSCPCGFHGDDFCKQIGCPRTRSRVRKGKLR